MFIIYWFLVICILKTTTNATHLNENCKKLKCPSTEDLMCVKVTYNKGANNTKGFKIIVHNKCEIGYIKCHPGLKAHFMPMESCHGDYVKNKRFKRAINRAKIKAFQKYGRQKKAFYGDTLSDSTSDEITLNQKTRLSHKKQNKKLINKKNITEVKEIIDDHDSKNVSDKIPDDEPKMNSKEALVVLEENSREVEEKDEFNVNLEENYAQNDEIQNDEPGSVHVIGDENDTNIQNAFDDEKPLKKEDEKSNEVHNGEKTLTIVKNESVGDVSDQEKDLQNNDEKRIDDNSGDKKSQYNNALKVPNDYDQEDDEEADLDENNKDCPTKCASSDMMICAHCQHGVFRTFMSVCHLRAFTCAHTDEKLSLVSRKPCVQSAPFLYDLPETKGRIEHSDDRVLQFIKCRRDGKLGKDPQCNFH